MRCMSAGMLGVACLVAIFLLLAPLAGAAPAGGEGPRRVRLILVPGEASEDETLQFAASEVRTLLTAVEGEAVVVSGPARDQAVSDRDEAARPAGGEVWHWRLVVDGGTADGQFAVSVDTGSDPATVTCRGGDSTAVLHAAYTALERLGWQFEVTGPVGPARLDWEALRGWGAEVVPAVRHRGIRQHLNFPMDVSSYPLDEAKEYIRNLARLRMNHITFHSYPGHWYGQGGKFFYGIRYDIPDREVFRGIRNESVYCIPSIEPVYDDADQRGRRAKQWLSALTAEARRCGLRVQFSFENRGLSTEEAAETARQILRTYPAIEVLELFTPETLGRPDELPTPDELEVAFAQMLAGEQPEREVPGFFRTVAHNLTAAKALRGELGERGVELAVGIYCPVEPLHRLAIPLLRKHVPEGITYTILPAHGERAVADNLADADLQAEDWRRGMMYSWLEFDGSMYLQQNAVEGIRRLLDLGRGALDGGQIHAVVLNHWRTAENRTAFRYASEAMLAGAIDPAAFYRDYARRLGIPRARQYATAMAGLDHTANWVRDKLFNIGFCYYGVWGREGLGKIARYRPERIDEAIAAYELVALALRDLPEARRAEGREYLSLLRNRLRATVLHLQAIRELTRLQELCAGRKPEELSDADRRRVRGICDRALELMDQHMRVHARQMPDRGCEGTLINYETIPPRIARRIRAEYGQASPAE